MRASSMAGKTSPAERYRTQFRQLDEQRAWDARLSWQEREVVRKAAAAQGTWREFLSGVAREAAVVRRVVALSLVGDTVVDDGRFERDWGMWGEGDDAGGVYRLLGEDEPPVVASDAGCNAEMAEFVGALRELCVPIRDEREVEARKKGAAKNVQRMAVSAACVVEELGEMENKASAGRFEKPEDCIKAVVQCIGNQERTFKDVLETLEERAQTLRDIYDNQRRRAEAFENIRCLTTGILGVGPRPAEDLMQESDDKDEAVTEAYAGLLSTEQDLSCWPIPGVVPEFLDEESTSTYVDEPVATKPTPPGFCPTGNSLAKNLPEQQRTDVAVKGSCLASVLGSANPILRNVQALKRVRELRVTALSQLSAQESAVENIEQPATKPATPPPPKPRPRAPPVEYVIRNEPTGFQETTDSDNSAELLGGPRQRAMARAVTALMCSHSGFTHSSSFALEALTDAWEDFVERIGHALSSCRQPIDQVLTEGSKPKEGVRIKTLEETREEVRIACGSGFRGGLPQLKQYISIDILRTDRALRDTEDRIRARIARSPVAPVVSSAEEAGGVTTPANAEANVVMTDADETDGGSADCTVAEHDLDETAILFGVMRDGVSLDILGDLSVPRKLAFAVMSNGNVKPEPGVHAALEEEITSFPVSDSATGSADSAPQRDKKIKEDAEILPMDVEEKP